MDGPQLEMVSSRRTTLEYYLVLLDGVVEIDIPESRIGFSFVESPKYGQVLFTPIDHEGTRMGYGFTNELFQKYGLELTGEDAIFRQSVRLLRSNLSSSSWTGTQYTRSNNG